MDPVGGSSPNEQYSEPTSGRGRRAEVDMSGDMCSDSNSPPHHASSSSFAASPTLVLDMRQSAGFTSATKSVHSWFPVPDGPHLPDLCGISGMDLEACEPSNYRHHHQVVGLLGMENLQDPAEILAQWTQLIPDEAFEQCFELDDLDSVLADCSGVMELPSSESGTPENSETTTSPSVNVGDRETRDDQTMITTSSDSVGTSIHRSAARKRKCRARNIEAGGDDCGGVEPGSRPKHSMDAGEQGRHLRKRLSSSSDQLTRYAIQTRTDVDIIDDGYKWRKYGQKPVKNSDHPRNYFRCTAPNCPVRKQVERCTDNPRNVLTTYNTKHNHPKSNPSPSTRESVPPGNNARHGDLEDLPSSTAPIRYHDGLLGPPRLPPSNYMSHNLLDHMLTGALLDRTTRWPTPPPPPQGGPPRSLPQRNNNIDLLRAQQLFMLQYQTQYPFLSSMLNLMHNYSLAQPPQPFLDPSFALLAAQNYGMRLRDASRNPAFHSPAHLSRSQQRILRMQELMGEQRASQQQQQPCEPTAHRPRII